MNDLVLDIHPLRPGEETLWLSVAASPEEIAQTHPKFADLVGGEKRRDRRCHLIAVGEEGAAGRLLGVFLNPRLYFIRELLTASAGDFEEVATAFAEYLARSFGPEGVEILTWERDDIRRLNAALARGGFAEGRRKVFVERDLAGYEPPDDPFTYATLGDVGETVFVRVMSRAAEGDPFEDAMARDPVDDFRELVEYAGDAFDPAWWRIAKVEGRTAGVVLPQRFPGPGDEGTLFYMGIVPELRGRGLGRALHAAGLGFLARAGVTRYVGSTDARNAPMLRVFAVNECRRKGVQLFLKAGS